MNYTPFQISFAALTILVVGVAMVTDLLWRRIPNFLTLSAFGVALVVRFFVQGWAGIGLALGGAVLAPGILWLLHGGKGIGMGDIKLAAAIGAIIGPVVAVPAMLMTAVAGGVLGIVWMLKPGASGAGKFDEGRTAVLSTQREEEFSSSTETMPYGVAIGVGSILTLAVCWWTGNENWFFSLAGIAGNP